MIDKLLPFVFLFSTLCGCSLLDFNRGSTGTNVDKEEFINQIKKVECDDADRLRGVERLLTNMGIRDSEVDIEKFEGVANVILTIKGKTDETVVVGGHYDKTTLGCGAIDNWTGIVIVANLYKKFKARDNEKTYKFIAFGQEEKGLVGSRVWVSGLPRSERKNYCAMVNFDSFGFTKIWALESISNSSLTNLAKEVAEDRKFTFELKNYRGASSDSKSFRQKNIPAITLSGLDDNWKDYLHQEGDQVKNIDFDKVYDNYLFAYDFIEEIDAKECSAFR